MEQKIPLSRSQASPAQPVISRAPLRPIRGAYEATDEAELLSPAHPVAISRTPLRPIRGTHEATDEAELLIALLAGFWLL